jgi:nucleoside-diphosphate-sugar epimerase
MRFAVTGGDGYIGSALIKGLVENGDTVTSIDNLMKGDYLTLQGYADSDDVKLIIGDIRDDDLLHEVFEDIDAVAHLAALPGATVIRYQTRSAIFGGRSCPLVHGSSSVRKNDHCDGR